jgi:flagella basal body P-ring formation protein FlgA
VRHLLFATPERVGCLRWLASKARHARDMSIMRSLLCAIAFAAALPAAFADTLELRPRIEAQGPAVTLGDVFANAGAEAARAIAPAPSPGQTSQLSTEFLMAAVQSAGLDWRAPDGMGAVQIVRPGGARATVAPAQGAAPYTPAGAPVVRRGDIIALVYETPGLRIATRARALQNGGVGERIRLENVQGGRALEAIVTSAGAARAD